MTPKATTGGDAWQRLEAWLYNNQHCAAHMKMYVYGKYWTVKLLNDRRAIIWGSGDNLSDAVEAALDQLNTK